MTGAESLMELHHEIVSKHSETKKMHEEITSLLAEADAAPHAPRLARESSSGRVNLSSHAMLPCSVRRVDAVERSAPHTH